MPDFDEQVQQYLRKIQRLVPDKDTQRKITNAGAQYLAKSLANDTQAKHFDTKHNIPKKMRGKAIRHLADSVDFTNTSLDGVVDGTSTVGFKGAHTSGVNHARIARFLNDGTKKMHGDHFVEHSREDHANDMFRKMNDVYRQSVKGGK